MASKFSLFITIGALLTCLSSPPAQATFIAALFSEDTFVIGADSRKTTEGLPPDDSFCKLVLLNDNTAFAMLGVPSVTVGAHHINIFDLNNQATVGATDFLQMARQFTNMGAAQLNRINPQLRSASKQLSGYPVISIGLYGGLGIVGSPSLAVSRIIYNERSNMFVTGQEEMLTNAGTIFMFNYFDHARGVVSMPEFARIRNNYSLPIPLRFAGMIDFLIQQMISRRVSIEVGGNPTVLILQKNKSASWYTRTGSCPRN